MGNCDNKEFVDDFTYTRQFGVEEGTTTKDPNEEFEKLMNQPFVCKKEVEIEDPLYTILKHVIPPHLSSTNFKDYKKDYKIKNSIQNT